MLLDSWLTSLRAKGRFSSQTRRRPRRRRERDSCWRTPLHIELLEDRRLLSAVVYSFSGTATGELGGTAFTDASYVITVMADTQDIIDLDQFFTNRATNLGVTASSATISIEGVGSGRVTSPGFQLMASTPDDTTKRGSVHLVTEDPVFDGATLISIFDTSLRDYDLTGPFGPITVTTFPYGFVHFNADRGVQIEDFGLLTMEAGLFDNFEHTFEAREATGEIVWRAPESGDFSDASKWNPATVPGASDTARINPTGSSYTITLTQNVTNDRLIVGGGTGIDATLDLGSFTYTANELILADSAGDSVTFTLTGGGGPVVSVASTADVSTADASPTSAPASEPNAKLDQVVVGGLGDGFWTINSESHVQFNSIKVGTSSLFGIGVVSMSGGAILREEGAGLLVIGDKSAGFFHMREGAMVHMPTGRIVVGGEKRGNMTVADGSTVTTDMLDLGDGFLSVDGTDSRMEVAEDLNMQGESTIRLSGDGSMVVTGETTIADTSSGLFAHGLEVSDGAKFSSERLNIVGDAEKGVELFDGGRIEVLFQLAITPIEPDDSPSMEVNNGSEVFVKFGSAFIDSGDQANPGLVVTGSSSVFSAFDTIRVGNNHVAYVEVCDGGRLFAPELIVQEGSTVRLEGPQSIGFTQVTGEVQMGCSPGTATLDGDFQLLGTGLLEIEIGGVTPGTEYDVLNVTGDAELGGTLELNFIDGFAPHAGDQFEFLNVDGALSGGFDEVTVLGLPPELSFEVVGTADGLTFSIPPLPIVMDVEPGSDVNPVNLHAKGVLPVAVLSTQVASGEEFDFDVTRLDPSTILLGDPREGFGQVSPLRSNQEDVDGDGDLDLILHFAMEEIQSQTALAADSIEVELAGETFDGHAVLGADHVGIVSHTSADAETAIADFTLYDVHELALRDILDEWRRTDLDAQQRAANLQSTAGVGTTGARLVVGETVLLDDGAEDVLTGSSGADWFSYLEEEDRVTDLTDKLFESDLEFI